MIRNRIRNRRSRLLDTEDFLHNSGPLVSAHSHYIPYPTANVKEHEDFYDLELAIPGFSKEELNISLEDYTLTIKGEKERTENMDSVKFIRREHDLESFERVFELDDITDLNRIEASYVEGILKIRLYHTEDASKKQSKSYTVSIE